MSSYKNMVDPNSLWFSLPDAHTLCRAGGNGPAHPSQLYAIRKYVTPDMTFLDYGAGSATTFEAMRTAGIKVSRYMGLDIIPKFTVWCKENYPDGEWKVNPTIHKIDEPDASWDVVYSRHVVDHMESFEKAMDEMKRVAKKLVIAVFWVPMSASDEHDIKNIIDQRGLPTEKLYPNEYTNSYSRKKVMEYLDADKKWEVVELTEEVGVEIKGHDWVLVLKRI
jgi:ubiquinone/menaquinone biosynthesis C-methylase UbiE